jgi:hypothetical protein
VHDSVPKTIGKKTMGKTMIPFNKSSKQWEKKHKTTHIGWFNYGSGPPWSTISYQ